ncbi:MAG: hypothetical protein PHT79_01665 [Syntrophomonadaceae bacterium]|nr:hypothetical protein [Syntrophomonadaceae bacterium]MDD4548459.1 hypothetical protein [Syntrophomonadaceae bacterium]
MTAASGVIELWRRVALLLGILVGLALFFYVAPAMISVTAVDWEQEQADELKSSSGFVTGEDRRLSQLPLTEYIALKTEGNVKEVNPEQWTDFFAKVSLASNGQWNNSPYENRISKQDKDPFWKPTRPVPVFFKPEELPYQEWGLVPAENARIFLAVNNEGITSYLRLDYEDYQSTVTAMSKPYRAAPGWLYHPYRLLGIGFIITGLLFYLFLPRRKRQPEDIAYASGRLIAGDIVALIILVLFYGLAFLINGGTVQSVTGLWPISLIMWFFALFGVLLLYYSAWYASYQIELTPEALYLVTFKGVRECCFNEMASVELVSLRNPGWFRKLFIALALLSLVGGRSSPQPAGSALLAASAAYDGLEIRGHGGKPIYIWFTDQMGHTIIPNFDRVLQAIHKAGIQIKEETREIEGFSMFM